MEFVAHELHAEEEESKAHDGHAPLFHDALFEEGHDDADDDGGHADAADFEGDDLPCDGRSDVGAENDADGLLQRQQACVDEADDHDGGRSRRLDEGGDDGSRQDGDETVFREEMEDGAEALPGDAAEPFAHQLHGINEYGETAKNCKK